MSRSSLDRAVLAEAKIVLHNPRLKEKDIITWETRPINKEPGETKVYLPELRVNVIVENRFDKRSSGA